MLARPVRDEVRDAIAAAVADTLDDWAEGEIEDEPGISARLGTRIRDRLNELDLDGVSIHARVRILGDRGPGAAENRYGADIAVVLRVDTDDDSITKGALIQAKRSGSEGVRISGEVRQSVLVGNVSDRLRDQCDRMLDITSESYLWVYDPDGGTARSVRATSVIAGRPNRSRNAVASDTLDEFVEQMLVCRVGDVRLNAITDVALDALRRPQQLLVAVAVEVLGAGREPVMVEANDAGPNPVGDNRVARDDQQG